MEERKVQTEEIPDHAKIRIARWAIALMEEVFSHPGEEEKYQAWLAERRKKEALA